ncbi:hypothetical protein C9374_009401 [Naegleria lovaniensis]|uniref:Kinesin motor domain-containing protein n=1 Tax=Naegleria lovaniensis TaxID=51637 RepID=A0AA88GI00_NAELO|nr:uncharacterized protein C9374_009401 [Naegleria lovaniensis]KAG2377490.1 hypothetical protein C9374_009401 [Naegleria lovaniensis]
MSSQHPHRSKVVVRFKPSLSSTRERSSSTTSNNHNSTSQSHQHQELFVVEGNNSIKVVQQQSSQESVKTFWPADEPLPSKMEFDRVFKGDASQEALYQAAIGSSLIKDLLSGMNHNMMVYGTKDSGKTFCLIGGSLEKKEHEYGIVPRIGMDLFESIEEESSNDQPNANRKEYKVSFAMMEVYEEKIYDLLEPNHAERHLLNSPYKGLFVHHLSEICVGSYDEFMELLRFGTKVQQVCRAKMNLDATKCHTVISIKVVATDIDTEESWHSLLNCVEIATGSDRDSLAHSSSFSSLIQTLCAKQQHEPQNNLNACSNNTLTQILHESFGGNAKTTLICTCSSSPQSYEESFSSLLFGFLIKTRVSGSVHANTLKSAWQLQAMITKLEKQFSDMNSSQSQFPPKKIVELEMLVEELKDKHHAEIHNMKNENTRLEKELTTLKSNMKKQKEERSKLQEELDRTKELMESSSKKQEDLQSNHQYKTKELELEIKSLREQLTEEEKKRNELLKELENVKEESKLNTAHLQELAQNISESEARAKIMFGLDKLTESNKMYRSMIGKLNERIYDLEEKLEESERKFANLEAETSSQEEFNSREISRLEKENKQLSKKVRKYEKELEDMDEECVDLEMELNKCIGEVETLEDTTEDLKEKIVKLEKEISSKDEEIIILKTQLKKAENETMLDEDLEDFILDEYSDKVKKLRDQAAAVEAKKDRLIEKYKTEALEERKNIKTLEKDYNRKLDRLEDELEEEKEKFENMEADFLDLEEKSDKHKDKIKLLEKELKALEKLLEDKDDFLENIKADYEESTKSKDKDLEQLTIHKEALKQQLSELQSSSNKQGSSDTDSSWKQKAGKNWANDFFEMKNKLEKVQTLKDKFEKESLQSRQQIQSERSKLQAANKKIELQNSRILELQKELDMTRSQKGLKHQVREKQKQKKQEMQEELEKLQKALVANEHVSVMQPKISRRKAVFKPAFKHVLQEGDSSNELAQVFQSRAHKE